MLKIQKLLIEKTFMNNEIHSKQTPIDSEPKMENAKVPNWIKIMWILGVLWIALYVIRGLASAPQTW
jgi:tryptophan-rich sensory protein